MGEWIGVFIAILSSSLGGTAAAVTRYLVGDADALTLAMLRWGIGGARMLPHFSAHVTSKTALIRFSECLAAEVKAEGIAVFAMGSGTVRTAMSEHSLNSPEGKTWLPWFREIFDKGQDLPPERPASLLLALASGRADALSGCFLTPSDDLDRVVEAAADLGKEKLYALQVRRL